MTTAETEYVKAKTSVWWDIENCEVPKGWDAHAIAQSVSSALLNMNYCGPVSISAYGDTNLIPPLVQQALSSTGVGLNHVPAGVKDASDKKILVDMLLWAVDNPAPANIMLISGDRDFSNALHQLRMRRYNILLAQPPRASVPLVAAAKNVWLWTSLASGGPPLESGESARLVNNSDAGDNKDHHHLLEDGLIRNLRKQKQIVDFFMQAKFAGSQKAQATVSAKPIQEANLVAIHKAQATVSTKPIQEVKLVASGKAQATVSAKPIQEAKLVAESLSESTSESLTTTSTKPAQSGTVTILTPESHHVLLPEIPIEIVSEEEMATLDAALAATRSIFPSVIRSSSPSRILAGGSPKTIHSITLFSKRKLSGCSDIEDTYLHRFRKNQALGVTDLTGTEWCEKQMENVLCFGRRKVSKAMKLGQARHLELEEEVVRKVRVKVESNEDKWALKLLNSIAGVNQFLFEGRTRELFLLGFVGGQWIVGIIDELRKAYAEESSDSGPILIDTKTRLRDTLPAEPQRRNGRLQLMLYKLLWDTIVKEGFPAGLFFDYFSLNRHYVLSQDVRDNIANAGIQAQTLEEIVRYYEKTFKMLPVANDQLLLKYEFQKDQSIIAEIRFHHDHEWAMSKYRQVIEFWKNEREAEYTPEEERWKCRYCQFAKSCLGNPSFESPTPSSPPREAPPPPLAS